MRVPINDVMSYSMVGKPFYRNIMSGNGVRLRTIVTLTNRFPIRPLSRLFNLFYERITTNGRRFVTTRPRNRTLQQRIFPSRPTRPLRRRITMLITMNVVRALRMVTITRSSHSKRGNSLRLLYALCLRMITIVRANRFVISNPILNLFFRPRPFNSVAGGPRSTSSLSLRRGKILFSLVMYHPVLPKRLNSGTNSLTNNGRLLILLVVGTNLFLTTPSLRVYLTRRVLFLPFSMKRRDPGIQGGGVATFHVLRGRIHQYATRGNRRFFMTRHVSPLRPITPPFRFSFLLFCRVLLCRQYAYFTDIAYIPSAVQGEAAPPQYEQGEPLARLESTTFLSTLVQLHSTTPYNVTKYATNDDNRTKPTTTNKYPTPRFCHKATQ